eukprot:XP_002260537.1 hypothetical protein, conserved in Plasmodium species [Plasmodium knowlesi strain H]
MCAYLNIEFVGDKGVEELINKISENYEECTKYDAYMAQDEEAEEEVDDNEKEYVGMGGSFQNVKTCGRTKMASIEKLEKKETANSSSRADGKARKGCNNSAMDNIRDFIFKKKMSNNRNNGKDGNFGRTGRNVKKKRIMESSDDSDENSHSVKKIIDYVKKKKKNRKG